MKQHAHRPESDYGWPRITGADARSLFWLIVFALLFIAITVVEAP